MPASSDESASPARPAAKRKASLAEIQVDLSAPEPPSKRARRALKRGKALVTPAAGPRSAATSSAAADDDDDDKDEDAAVAGSKPPKARSEHGVWIGNLPFSLTAPQLKQWLVDNAGGLVLDRSITRIKLPTVKEPAREAAAAKKKTNKGFAYVDLADVAAKYAVMALSETELAGRRLLIKDAASFDGRPPKTPALPPIPSADASTAVTTTNSSAAAAASKTGRKIYVGNLSFNTTDDDLSRNFEKCGDIESVKLATFEDSGKCKGYGWVQFKDPSAAAWAVKGFVKIREPVETEADFPSIKDAADNDNDDDADNDDNDDDAAKPKPAFRTRKWWVNRILGRQLKLELAEDDQLRYKKRFGRDASSALGRNPRHPALGASHKAAPAAVSPPGADDLQVARLTGALVKPTGTKILFD